MFKQIGNEISNMFIDKLRPTIRREVPQLIEYLHISTYRDATRDVAATILSRLANNGRFCVCRHINMN